MALYDFYQRRLQQTLLYRDHGYIVKDEMESAQETIEVQVLQLTVKPRCLCNWARDCRRNGSLQLDLRGRYVRDFILWHEDLHLKFES